ncbi:UNVERIFIED_CONTAM: hypothetical protein K2H54_069256 [Gekko kuhli]
MACLAEGHSVKRDELKLSNRLLIVSSGLCKVSSLLSEKGIALTSKSFVINGNRKRFLVKRWLSWDGSCRRGGGGGRFQTISHMLVILKKKKGVICKYIYKKEVSPGLSSRSKIP